MTENTTKRGRPVGVSNNQVRNQVLKNLLSAGGKATAKAVGASPAQIAQMAKTGVVKATKGRVATGARPAILYCLTLKGRHIAKSL